MRKKKIKRGRPPLPKKRGRPRKVDKMKLGRKPRRKVELCTTAPRYGSVYYYPHFAVEDLYTVAVWYGAYDDKVRLRLGQVCKTAEDASFMARAMLKAIGIVPSNTTIIDEIVQQYEDRAEDAN